MFTHSSFLEGNVIGRCYLLEKEENLAIKIDEICERYYKDVYRYCLFFTNNRTEAEDLTQETFLKILKGLKHFRNQSYIKTWVLSVAKNTAIDYYRRKKLIQFVPDLFLTNLKTTRGLPEEQLQHKEEQHQIQEALLLLKPFYRNVVILKGLQELSIEETAQILGCSELKVRVDYHRAIKKLSMIISKERRNEDEDGEITKSIKKSP